MLLLKTWNIHNDVLVILLNFWGELLRFGIQCIIFCSLGLMCFVCSGKPCPPFKIIVLDEADSMTGPAQVSNLSLRSVGLNQPSLDQFETKLHMSINLIKIRPSIRPHFCYSKI